MTGTRRTDRTVADSFMQQLRRRFPEAVAVLHSEMPDAARASHWLAAATGEARIVLVTAPDVDVAERIVQRAGPRVKGAT